MTSINTIAISAGDPLYSGVISQAKEYGALVFFLVSVNIAEALLIFYLIRRLISMMEKVVGMGNKTADAIEGTSKVIDKISGSGQ